MPKDRWLVALLIAALGFVLVNRVEGYTQVPTTEETLNALGYSIKEQEAFRAGDIVAKNLEEIMESELVAAVSMIIPVPLDRVCEAILGTPAAVRSANVIDHGLVTKPAKNAEWSDLAFTKDEVDEVRLLLKAKPGNEVNLSQGEFAVLTDKLAGVKASDADAATRVSNAYRAILLDRFRRYSEGGIEAIQPYVRGSANPISPGAEIRAAFKEAEPFLRRYFPDFAAALAGFPETATNGIDHRFSWLKRRLQDRPAFILLHETFARNEHYCLMSERQYFVGHSYNSLSAVTLMLPAEDRTAIFYVNSTRTDRITGFLGSVGRSVGQDRLREALERHFTTLRDQTGD